MSFASGGSIALAGNPPSKYYVDEAKLPFDALPGTNTDRYWAFTEELVIALRCQKIGMEN